MPPLPDVAAVKIEVAGHNEDASFVNLFHVATNMAAPCTSGDLVNIDAAFNPAIAHVFNHNAVDSIVIDSIKYIDLTTSSGVELDQPCSVVGTLTGDVLPAQAAIVVSWPTARRWRGGHPRSYMMLGSSSTLAGSSMRDWQSSFQTNVQADMASVRTDVNGVFNHLGSQFELCSVSYRTAGAPRVTPLIDYLGAPDAKPRVCSQRRRLGKVGG
jgi:hypothetical protein